MHGHQYHLFCINKLAVDGIFVLFKVPVVLFVRYLIMLEASKLRKFDTLAAVIIEEPFDSTT